MSYAMQRAEEQSSGIRLYLLAAYYLAAGHLSVTTILFGGLLILIAATVLSGLHDVFAGMFGIWGVTFILFGAVAYLFLLANRIYAHVSE